MLSELDVEAFALRDVMDPATADIEIIEWIESNSEFDSWVFVTGDLKTRTRPLEGSVFSETDVTLIYFANFWCKKKLWDQAAWLVAKWPMIREFCETSEKGACAEVQQNGRLNRFNF